MDGKSLHDKPNCSVAVWLLNLVATYRKRGQVAEKFVSCGTEETEFQLLPTTCRTGTNAVWT